MTERDDDMLATLVQWHEAADQATVDSRLESEKARDYYDGKQWTAAEREVLRKRKQPVVTNNRIKPKINFLKGQEAMRRRMPKAFPRTPAEEHGAAAATESIRYVMDVSKWDRRRSLCFANHAIEGACGSDIQVAQKGEEYEITVVPIHWDRMWWDPHSREVDFSDARYKGQFLWMDVEEAKRRWPKYKDKLDATLASGGTGADTYADKPRLRWADPKRKRVRIAECWYEGDDGGIYFAQFTKSCVLSKIESPFLNEDDEPEDGFVFGSCYIDADGNRYGVVKDWISIQDEINKRRSKALHLVSVRQTWGNQLAGDKNAFRKALAEPDGHVPVEAGGKFGEDFGVLPTGDMANGQFQLLNESKSEIDSQGVNAAMSGTESRNMSGRALLARNEQGLAELGPVFDNFSQFQHDVYRKVWNRIRQFWTAEKWIRVTDDERNVKFVGINQPLTLGEQLLEEWKQANPEAPPEAVTQAEQQAKMDPAMQRVVGTKNKIADLDVDIVLDDVPASATLETETFDNLMEIAPHAASMPPPMFEALLEASPLHPTKKERVLKKLQGGQEGQIPPQLKQQMDGMQKALQEAEQKVAEAEAVAMQAKAAGPAAELARREQELKYREDALKSQMQLMETQKQVLDLQLQLRAEKTGRATDKMNNAASDLNAATTTALNPQPAGLPA